MRPSTNSQLASSHLRHFAKRGRKGKQLVRKCAVAWTKWPRAHPTSSRPPACTYERTCDPHTLTSVCHILGGPGERRPREGRPKEGPVPGRAVPGALNMNDQTKTLKPPHKNRETNTHATQTHTNTLKHTQTHTNTHKHTLTHTNTHKHTQTHTNTHKHTLTHTNTHSHTLTHTNTH